jgi:hypothetical protein
MRPLLRIPTRIRHLPIFLREVCARAAVSRRPLPDVTFHMCYFTCGSYVRYLLCSLHSLRRLRDTPRLRIILFCDDRDPFTAEQRQRIAEIAPDALVLDWPNSQGWGAEQIANIWRAYEWVATQSGPGDYIVRVDSDVFFFSAWIFDLVARSRADFVGDGHFVGFQWGQGGLYFLKSSAARSACELVAREGLKPLLDRAGIIVEDVAVHHLLRLVGASIWLTWFMMFPDELRNARGLGAYQRWKFACLHFVSRHKEGMLVAYEENMVDPGERAAFRTLVRA